MRITTRAYGAVAWAMGRRHLTVDLPGSPTVGDLLRVLAQQHAGLSAYLATGPLAVTDVLMIVIGSDEVSTKHKLADGDEVLLVVPAAGGSGT